MNIVVLMNGLGNQMFQYAFCMAKQVDSKTVFSTYFIKRHDVHHGYELERVFQIPEYRNFFIDGLVRFARKLVYLRTHPNWKRLVHFLLLLMKYCGMHVITEDNRFGWNHNMLKERSGLNIYIGNWLSERYFEKIRMQNIYRFDLKKLNMKSNTIKDIIINSNSISVHVRRGDYMNQQNKATLGNVCSTGYYLQAIEYINQHIFSPVFFIFSDDMQWVKNNLQIDGKEIYYVDWNIGHESWQDMCLMSLCKHNINANSTFSWWGAWLNNNLQKIVIVPQLFACKIDIHDIYPDNWIKL